MDFKNQKLWTLELIRGLAALAVVVCHFFLNFPEIGRSELRNAVANWGVTAVVVFFVLSGAVIRISIERSGFSFGKFMRKRIIRIVPLYFLAILLTLMIEPRPFLPEKLVGHLAFTATVQGWITPTYTSNPVLWSLSYEMGFYLIFALLQHFFRKADWVGWGLAACAGTSFFLLHDLAGPWEHLRTLFACYGVWLIGYESLRYQKKIRLPVSATVLAV
jgi:peptidoglycan/LPS O-acetylase OafA/YrhL